MQLRFTGLLVAFVAIVGFVALQPGSSRDTAAAVVETGTPGTPGTSTTVPATATSTTVPATATVAASPTATSTPGPASAPVLLFPTSQCIGTFPFPTSANVTFFWIGPSNVSSIYLDVSTLDNNFADGTYITFVFPSGTTSFTLNGAQPGQALFWRVTGLGLNGQFVSSNFAGLTPCAPQRLLSTSWVCTGSGRATVTFRWAPTSSPGLLQFLDITLFNNGFAPNTFLGAGALPPDQQALIWPGILANSVHYWRVNTLTLFGWGPSQTGTFVAQCPL